MKKIKPLLKLITIFSVFLVFTLSITIPTNAGVKEDLDAVQKKLELIRQEKKQVNNQLKQEQQNVGAYNSELKKLSSDIAVLESSIAETELEIQELQLQIKILNDEIAQIEKDITTSEDEITILAAEANDVMIDMYMDYKINGKFDVVLNSSAGNILKQEIYSETVSDENNTVLTKLTIKKAELANKQDRLETSRVSVSRDEVAVTEKKNTLSKSQEQLKDQQAIYVKKRDESFANAEKQKELLKSITKEEEKTLAEQTRLEQIEMDRIKSIPNGTYVAAGTIIGKQGCTGLCTGPHLHFAMQKNGQNVNPCDHMKSGGPCGGNGSLSWPQKGNFYLSSPYGYRWGKFHFGIDLPNRVSDAPIYTAHSGYMIKSFVACNKSNSLCKGGGANVVTVCENKNCNVGYKTQYWHLR